MSGSSGGGPSAAFGTARPLDGSEPSLAPAPLSSVLLLNRSDESANIPVDGRTLRFALPVLARLSVKIEVVDVRGDRVQEAESPSPLSELLSLLLPRLS